MLSPKTNSMEISVEDVIDYFLFLRLTLCMLCNISCFCCCLLTSFKIDSSKNSSCLCCCLLTSFKINFSKNSFRNTIRVSNSLIQIRTDVLSVLFWVQTVQMTKVTPCKEEISTEFLFPCFFKTLSLSFVM